MSRCAPTIQIVHSLESIADTLLFPVRTKQRRLARVVEHMKFLYLNSELFLPSERLHFFTEEAWQGLIHQEGPRIMIGDDPILIRSWVDDLHIESVYAGKQIVRWTQPPGLRLRFGTIERETLGNQRRSL